MSEEYEEEVNGEEETSMTGPGAPTPVSALEVRNSSPLDYVPCRTYCCMKGSCRSYEA